MEYELHIGYDKCDWYKKELMEIAKIFMQEHSSKLKIEPIEDRILLTSDYIKSIRLSDLIQLENKYTDITNYFIYNSKLIIKIEKHENLSQIPEIEEDEQKKKYLTETSKEIEIIHSWNKKLKSAGSITKYEKSDFSSFIEKIRYLMRKLIITDSKSKINIIKFHPDMITFTLEELCKNIQLKRLYLELSFLCEEFSFNKPEESNIKIIGNKNIEITIKKTKKRKLYEIDVDETDIQESDIKRKRKF